MPLTKAEKRKQKSFVNRAHKIEKAGTKLVHDVNREMKRQMKKS